MMAREKKIQKLKEYFERSDDVIMAFLFGSQAGESATVQSDWDAGVYLKDGGERAVVNTIRSAVEAITSANADVVVLNNASARVAWPVVSSGLLLVNKDHDEYMRLVNRLSEEADSWYQTADDYYRIFQRSTSLSAMDKARLQEIIEFLDSAVEEFERFRGLEQQVYMNNVDIKRSVEHWIEHLVNAVVDIAKTIRASSKRPLPGTYREFVIALSGIAPFDQDDSVKKLADWVYLRNALAHEYLDYRWKEIKAFANEMEPLYRKLSEHTKAYLEKEGRS
jgi:uncharacterized protein YutE (UPF0331/DUF86 family)/predicted nucleotidyltransferase